MSRDQRNIRTETCRLVSASTSAYIETENANRYMLRPAVCLLESVVRACEKVSTTTAADALALGFSAYPAVFQRIYSGLCPAVETGTVWLVSLRTPSKTVSGFALNNSGNA